MIAKDHVFNDEYTKQKSMQEKLINESQPRRKQTSKDEEFEVINELVLENSDISS